jgi:RND superfamily putative drug exporter
LFAAWARFVFRRRRGVLAASVLFIAGAVLALARGGTLTSGLIKGIESERALELVREATGKPPGSQFTVVFASPALSYDDPRFAEEMRRALAPAAADPRVHSVETPGDLPEPLARQRVSPSGHVAVAHVTLRDEFRVAQHVYPEIRALIRSDALEVLFTGYLPFKQDLDRTLEADLIRAEVVSVPLALIVLLAVFATVVAALLPVGVGLLAVVGGVAAVMLLSGVTDMAQYTINVVTLIGLGVAIDYSLFIVSRYRDELARGAGTEEALVVAIATAGRAVAFSGLAVGIGLGGLLFFPHSYLYAMGVAGAIVVGLAVASALSFLPALLAELGEGIHHGRLPFALPAGTGVWRSIAHAVMQRPLLVLIPTLAFVVLVGSPFRRLTMAAADMRVLPAGVEARRGHELLRRELPAEAANRIVVAVRFPSAPALTPERITALYQLSRRVAALPSVRTVESVVDLDPRLELGGYQTLYALPRAFLPSGIRFALRETVGERAVVLAAVSDAPVWSDEARAVVRAIRADRRVGDGELLVTGATANDIDATEFILGHTPAAVGFVMAATYLILFLLLGSVVLPLKAVVMNLLSIAGSFGALVWIFQDGHLAGVLGFEPGPIEPTLPVLLFCALFGLSMDYEVLLLTRIQEEYERTGDNTHAVADGLERSGRLITSAAAIMVAVFAAFALADIVLVKAMGLGMALAVALDATLVRVLIVPATMRLFGDLNWWAPRWLRWR